MRLREKLKHGLPAGVCGVRNSVTDPCWLCAVSQEIAEELGVLSSDSSEEEVLTTRVVRRRILIQVKESMAQLWKGVFVKQDF